jgi:hypothetical protein
LSRPRTGTRRDQFTTDVLRERYAPHALYHTFVQVSVGVDRDMSGHPHVMKAETAVPFEVAGKTRTELRYQHYGFDPAVAPPGKTAVCPLRPCAGRRSSGRFARMTRGSSGPADARCSFVDDTS